MTERRRAADRVAGRLARFVGLGLTRRAAEVRAQPRRIDTVRARRQREHGPDAVDDEHQRLHDRGDVAADGGGRVLRGAGAVGVLRDVDRHARGLHRVDEPVHCLDASRLSADPARNQSMCSSDIVWFAANSSVEPSAWWSTTVT